MLIWSHPFDLHYNISGIKGWPKLRIEIWHLDAFGRCEKCAYGMIYIPTAPGRHELDVTCCKL